MADGYGKKLMIKDRLAVMRLTHTEFADFYMQLCDVITRDQLHIAEGDPFTHTCAPARHLALAIINRLANAGYLEYR